MSPFCKTFYVCVVWTVLVSIHIATTSRSYDADYDPIKNFSCFIYDYEEYILCSWDVQQGYIGKINITVYKWVKYLPEDKPVSIFCSEKSEAHCQMDMKTLDIDSTNHHLNICVILNCYHIDDKTLVKPSPVGNIESKSNSTCIQIFWNHNKSDVSQYPEQTYRVRLLSQWNMKNNNTIYSSTTEVIICGLIPKTSYVSYVSVKPVGPGLWSDERHIAIDTLTDVPYSPPKSCRNCFSIINERTSTDLYLYWEGLPKWKWNDDRLKYCIFTLNDERRARNLTKCDYLIDENTIAVRITRSHPLLIGIRSSNSKGVSSTYSEVTIPAKTQLLTIPESLGIMDKHNQLLNITWVSSATDDNVTHVVFWCNVGSSANCKEDVHWRISPSDVYWMAVNSSDTNIKFAVAVEKNRAVSGIQWNTCIITESGINISPEVEVHIAAEMLHISWHYPGCSYNILRNHISHHVVSYCQPEKCKDDDTNTTVVDSSETKLNMVFPAGFGSICLSVKSFLRRDSSQRSDMKCVNRQYKEATARDVIICISVPTLSVLLILLFIYHRCRRWLHRGLEAQLPDINPVANRAKHDTSRENFECNVKLIDFSKNNIKEQK